ncbi:MAG: leucyl aminopeptidase [Arcobacter sp.]|nr:leucyl aminopeptidase [Arcobacter sp.]
MTIKLINGIEKQLKEDIEIIILKDVKTLEENLKKKLKKIGFKAKEGQTCFFGKKLYVGTSSLKGEDLKIALSNAIRILNNTQYKKFLISLVRDNFEFSLDTIVEGLVLGSYKFTKYKSQKEKNQIKLFIDVDNSKKPIKILNSELQKNLQISSSVNLVRDIVNTPPEDFYPKKMVQKAKKIASENNLTCEVYGEEYLLKNKMNAMLAVGRASRHESQLIHLTYKPKSPKGKVVIVGKGLTYDCGGLSLKSSTGMVSMKCDKSGGSAVLGIMNAISKLDYSYEVHGIIGAVENMIGGDAYKPDDILKAKNGKTIEVKNTDAEGRLVLADCLCYAQDEIKNIDYIFDVATLTGACIIGLGEYTTGVMGHSEKLKKKMLKASKDSGELVGILPYNRYLPSMIKSEVADIVNSTSSKAGSAITASLFLDNFIKKENKKKWLHLDIAGAAYREKVWGYNPYGASGTGVRLLLKFIENL